MNSITRSRGVVVKAPRTVFAGMTRSSSVALLPLTNARLNSAILEPHSTPSRLHYKSLIRTLRFVRWAKPLTTARGAQAALLLLAGSGCTMLEVDPVDVSKPSAAAAAAEPSDPVTSTSQELDAGIVFDYLLADIAERRGEHAVGLASAIRVAERTRDPALALRAFRAAMRGGDSGAALRMADLMQEGGVDSLRVAFARVQAFLLDGRESEALAEIAALLAAEPGNRETIFNNAGEVYAQQTDPSLHLDSIRSLADRYPDDPHGFFAVAYVANRARDFDTLDEAISRALELDPDWEQAAIVRFVYLVQIGEHAAAGDFAREFVERNPDAFGLTERHARLLAAHGEMAEAKPYFDRILRERPEDSAILMAAALVRMQLEEWAAARRLLLKHLRLNPGSDETRMRLALVAFERGRHDESIEWYAEVRDEELVFDAQLRIADALVRTGGNEAALEHLQGLVPASRDEEVDLVLAQERILRDMGRMQDAYTLLDAAVQDIPDNGDLLYSRALLAAELDELVQHERDIRRVIELEPDNAHAYNALGYTLADQTDRYAEALDLITRALELAPEDPFILDSMGWVQFRLGEYEAAETYLRKALSIRNDAEIAAHLGEVLWVVGVRDEARALWDDALKADPGNRTLLDTLERLDP